MKLVRCALIMALAPFVLHQADAQPPPRPFSLQGVLTDTLGVPRPDGAHTMKFNICDAREGGAIVWSEQKSVQTIRGLFSVTLGDVTPLSMLDFTRAYWLGIEVDGTQEMAPRIELSATGFAYHSGNSIRAGVADSMAGARFTPGTLVRSVNSLTDNITLAGGTNVTISRQNDTLRISATGGAGSGLTLPYLDSIAGSAVAFKVITRGTGVGLFGVTDDGAGVQGESTSGNGVIGRSAAANGVYGVASGESGFGISGRNTADAAWGFVGGLVPTHVDATGEGRAGLYGEVTEGNNKFAGVYGVAGYANATATYNASGVLGVGLGFGVEGRGGYCGVSGWGESIGVKAKGTAYGVHAFADSTEGVGVSGWVDATSGTNMGVMGTTRSSSGYGVLGAAQFAGVGWALGCQGNFYQGGGIFVANPTSTTWTTNKPATVKLQDGSQVKLFTEEATEIYFSDYGEGKLNAGRAHIDVDPVFLQTVTVNARHPLKVFVQLEGDCMGVYVTNKTATGFDVVELQGGLSEANFTYRVMGKRKYYEDERLASEEEDTRFNTDMLNVVWPEVITAQQILQSRMRVMDEAAAREVEDRGGAGWRNDGKRGIR